MLKSALVGDKPRIERVYGQEHIAELSTRTELHREVIGSNEVDTYRDVLSRIDVIASTWGMPEFNEAQLDAMPNLKLVLYAAGDVRGFATPLIRRGIKVVSAWRANAVPVAEFTLAHVLLAGKCYLRNMSEFHANKQFRTAVRGPGNCGETLAIIGMGAVGRALVDLMKPLQWNLIAADPMLNDEEAARLGVAKVPLAEAFEKGFVVSNHVPDNASTKGLIDGALLRSMREGATFINTGRGRTVVQDEFVEVFRQRPDLTAVLDVTDPEPLPSDSPVWELQNVFVSTHIAGSIGNEVGNMAKLCLEELDRYVAGQPLQHLVTESLLAP